MIQTECARAEMLAGAIALGEAGDAERDSYRRHLARCQGCIDALGGERAIERVMETVARAREAERWEPDVRGFLRQGHRSRNAWRWGAAGLAAMAVVWLGVHAMPAVGIGPAAPTASHAIAFTYDGSHAASAPRAPHPARPTAASHAAAARTLLSAPALVVIHNVVTLTRPRVSSRAAGKPPSATRVVRDPAVVAALPPSERDERSIAAMRTVRIGSLPENRAESIAMAPSPNVVRDVMPLGGETAIVPRPSRLAFDEGAQGTAAFAVEVDARGTPTKCSITQPSGYLVLDVAVCRAAMSVRYAPRSINGRPVTSIYRDAFTFRSRGPVYPLHSHRCRGYQLECN